jgi:hypothetical protein
MDEDHMAILELLLGELEDARLRRIIEGDVTIGRACDIERQLIRGVIGIDRMQNVGRENHRNALIERNRQTP